MPWLQAYEFADKENCMTKNEFSGPLVVTGSSRSGTSFLYRIANSLPGVLVTYESNIVKDALQGFRTQDVLASRWAFTDYLNNLKRIATRSGRNFSFEKAPEFYDRLFESFSEHRDFREFIADLYIAGRDCKIWGDKCEAAQIEVMRSLFPDTRVMWIVRDPRSVVCSFYEHSRGNYYTTSLSWVNVARQARELRESLGTGSVLIVRYEDLVAEPLRVFEEIKAFVGISEPADTSMIKKAHTDSIGKWRNILTPRETKRIEEICYDEMLSYGYEPIYALGRKNLNPIHYGLCMADHAIGLLKKRPWRLTQVLTFDTLMRWIRLYSSWRR